ncbi:GSCFA domain-containing protein [Segetibacter koreensis]|uniref:GSCFA domain-containing protein n=1 Tax=Segetibacter koreensis TaxID=398037 RepID=UPI00036E919B|nr:GSCFA domain-containing protein [Segetibacter koreensis]
MKLMLDVDIKSPSKKITYSDNIFLIGSCFTDHIGRRLHELKFNVLQNPNGILFDPVSVSKSLNSYINSKQYEHSDLFYLNELWQSWNHHSVFSGMVAGEVLKRINECQIKAHDHLQTSDWLIITLGSSFSYRLVENNRPVANCHRAPGQWFTKHLLATEETVICLEESMQYLKSFNPALKIIFTISPVRHIRDGVVENNRSKARLIEAVHCLVDKYDHIHYFPAYELVIDVLRDYRFYDIDLVHPNYAATEFVFNKFEQSFISEEARVIMEEIKRINNGYKHKPFQPETESHKLFLLNTLHAVKRLQERLPMLDFSKEINYFSTGSYL